MQESTDYKFKLNLFNDGTLSNTSSAFASISRGRLSLCLLENPLTSFINRVCLEISWYKWAIVTYLHLSSYGIGFVTSPFEEFQNCLRNTADQRIWCEAPNRKSSSTARADMYC